MVEKEIFIKCECHTHILGVEVLNDERDTEFVFSHWTYHSDFYSFSFLDRLKIVWDLLFKQEPVGVDVILSVEKASKLNIFLSRYLNDIIRE